MCKRIIFIEQRYEAWEVAREASLQSASFEQGMRRRLLAVMRKVNCEEQLRLRVRQLCDDALIRQGFILYLSNYVHID